MNVGTDMVKQGGGGVGENKLFESLILSDCRNGSQLLKMANVILKERSKKSPNQLCDNPFSPCYDTKLTLCLLI